MGKLISTGQFNKYYFFILGSITTKLLITFIIGFYPSLTPNKPLFLFGFKSNLLSQPIVRNILNFFGTGLGGLILEYIFFIKNKKIENQETQEKTNLNNSIINRKSQLIYNDINAKNKKIYHKKIFLIVFHTIME